MNPAKPTPLRVMHIVSGDLWAGAENLVYQLAVRQYANKDLQIMAVIFNEGMLVDKLRAAGVRTEVIRETEQSFLRLVYGVRKVTRTFGPDIIHTHRFKENIVGGLVSLTHGSIHSVRTVHGGPEYSFSTIRGKLIRSLDLFVARHIQKCAVFVSHELRDRLRNQYRGSQTSVIFNGINVDELRIHRMSPVARRNTTREFRVCFAGRLTAVKRADIFLESARLLIKSGADNMHFYILGEGPELDSCREFIQRHSLSDRIHLLGFQQDLYPLLATMDVLIISSDHEGLPIILLEGMVLGVVIVARAVGGIPEALADGESGILINSDQPEKFAQAITNIFENDATATVLTDKSTLRAATIFDSRIMADKYARLYSKIAK